MKREKRNVLIQMIIMISLGSICGCGVTSNSSPAGAGAAEGVGYNSSRSSSPGDLARMQNQSIAGAGNLASPEMTGGGETAGDQVAGLYNGLSSSNPAVRKNAERTLRDLVEYNPEYLDELKQMEKENKNPNSWYAASLIIKEAEKAKSAAEDEEIRRQIEESQAADSAAQ